MKKMSDRILDFRDKFSAVPHVDKFTYENNIIILNIT